MEKIKHPAIRYHGAKFRLASWVMSHFPDHQCYVEPFAGGAGILLQKPRVYAEVYNDLDSEVVNLFRVLRDPHLNKRLIDLCRLTPFSREEFKLAYEETNNSVEKARRMIVRATMGFGSASSSGGTSGFRTDTKRKYATAQHLWERYPDNLAAICSRLQGVLIENDNAIKIMQKHDGKETLHYCDPPYLPETRVSGNRYYNHEMTIEDHEELLLSVKKLNGMVVISGYDSELYNDTLSGWRKEKKMARISAARGTKTKLECLWLSENCTTINN